MLDGQISHDKITRFLNGDSVTSKDLWQYIKPNVRKIEESKGGVLILDDSIEEKPYTDENEIVAWHYSHAKHTCVKGINLLSCLVRYGDNAFPVAFELIRKDVLFCDVKTKKEKRQSSINKNELFRSMVEQSIKNEILFDCVLADNWFGSNENMRFIHYDMKKKFIMGIKSNRLVACEEDGKKGQYQNLSSLNLKDREKRIVSVKNCSFSVALIDQDLQKRRRLYENSNHLQGSALNEEKLSLTLYRNRQHGFIPIDLEI